VRTIIARIFMSLSYRQPLVVCAMLSMLMAIHAWMIRADMRIIFEQDSRILDWPRLIKQAER